MQLILEAKKFDGDGTQNYLVFQSVYKYFELVSGGNSQIFSWKSKGLCNEKIIYIVKSSNSQTPSISYSNARVAPIFSGDPLKQNNVTYKHGPIVNIHTVYRLIPKINY